MSIDVQMLKQRIDLVDLASRDTRLRKIASTRGGEYAGACPFCGGQDRFHVQPEKGLWFCRQCSPDGRWQDAIAFVMRRDGVGFAEACRLLGASPSELGTSTRVARIEPSFKFADDLQPPEAWLDRAAEFVEHCGASLWSDSGARARTYLASRGLKEETLRAWRVGFQPEEHRREPSSSWGLDGPPVWLPRGIVLPWLLGERVWQLKVRTNSPDPKERYKAVRGGHPLLYGADTLVPGAPAVIAEGELDTLLLWQYARNDTATVSLGNARPTPTRRGALLLAQATPLFVAYDNDKAGDDAAERLQKLAPRVRRIRPPVGKDIGEFVGAGGRVRAWITLELRRAAAAVS